MSALAWSVSLPGKCRGLVRAHFLRIVLSIVAAAPLIALSSWLLSYEVSQQDVNPMAAYAVNWPLITVLAFAINWFIWMDRKTDLLIALRRWIVASLAHSALSYGLFMLMVWAFKWPYLHVSLGLTAVLGLCSYILRHRWIFARGSQETVG